MTMPAPAGVLCGTAPGRAEWLGNHTDYNDGLVLGIGLDVGTVVRATKRPDRVLRMEAQDLGQSFEVSIEALHPVASGSWANYVIGVAAGFVARGAQTGGLDLTISSTVPIGAGLSSSAALECATGRVLQQAWGTDFDELELARIGQEAEHNFAGVCYGLYQRPVGRRLLAWAGGTGVPPVMIRKHGRDARAPSFCRGPKAKGRWYYSIS
ncbi:MAG: Galactokinase [Verrucomicrobiota bacterium]